LAYAPRILIVDDEPEVRILFEEALSQDGYYVTVAGTGRHALAVLRTSEFDLVVSDLSLPDLDGLALIGQIRSEFPYIKILAISGYMAGLLPETVVRAGATDTLDKPTTPRRLLSAVYSLIDGTCSWAGA
jgi:CheY-like chemotaxis protein